jgi:hypothetical protein
MSGLQWVGVIGGGFVVLAATALAVILIWAYREDQRAQAERRRVDQLNSGEETRCDLECCNPPRKPLTPEEARRNDAIVRQLLGEASFAPGVEVTLPSGEVWVPPEQPERQYATDHHWTPGSTTNPFNKGDSCHVMLARYVCPYTKEEHPPGPPEQVDMFGYPQRSDDQ